MTTDLNEFLLARIAEDEDRAKAAPVGSGRSWFAPEEWGDALRPSREQTRHIVAWDPARVLAECEAKRRIVELAQQATATAEQVRSIGGEYPFADGVRRTLRYLALPYADHPDYREEWRP